MPVPSNISGLSYNDDIEFNDEELEGLKLFNGYPINTQTFPSASRYIWTFYSGSSIELLEGDPFLHFDHTQSFQSSSNVGAPYDDIDARWVPRGWYDPSGSNDTAISDNLTSLQIKNLFNKLRTWQIGIRMGISGRLEGGLETDNAAGFLDSASQFYAADPSITASVYSQRQKAGYDRYAISPSKDRGGWVNGRDAVFPTRTIFVNTNSEELQQCWNGHFTGSADGYAIGNNTTFSNVPDGNFGVAGAPPATASPFSDISPLPDSGSSEGRFLWSPSTSVGGHDATHKAFRVLRTPQRIFNHSNSITRKFVGFYYHFHSYSPLATQLASRQVINGVEYYTTVWATQYNRTSTFNNGYYNTTNNNLYEGLIHKQRAGIFDFVYIQPTPKFIGGITADDVGSWFPGSGANFAGSYYTEFPERQHAPWKNKVLEIPSDAFDYVGTTRVTDDANNEFFIGQETTIQGVEISDGTTTGNGLYIYIVTSPSKAGAENSSNINKGRTPSTPTPCIANVQMAEYDQGLVPQSILDQLG